MADRFDLENALTNFSNLEDDLDLLARAVMDNVIDQDDIANALIGLSVMAKVRAWHTFDVFKDVFGLDEYSVRHRTGTACSDDDTSSYED